MKTYFVTRKVCVEHGTRLLNYFIDYVFSLLIGGVLIGMLALISIDSEAEEIFTDLENLNRLEEYLLGICITVPYYFFSELLSQRTLGKLITGTIVVDAEGNKPTATSILIRSLSRVVPFDGLSFLGSNARGWHDSWSKTYVVNKKKLDQERLTFTSLETLGSVEETI